jgi:lysophospholipase L1-like esterase
MRLLRPAVLAAAGALALLAGEAAYVTRRHFLPADSAPTVGGTFGRAFAPPLRLAVLGDSTGAGVGVTRLEETVAARAAETLASTGRFVTLDGVAVSGSRSADLAPQVSRALLHRPDVALILIGANDATHGTPLDDVRRAVRDAVDRLRAAGAEVVVGTCPDMGAATALPQPLRATAAWQGRRVGQATREAAGKAGALTVDIGAETGAAFRSDPGRYLSSDEFHPSAAGYALWAEALSGALEEVGRRIGRATKAP